MAEISAGHTGTKVQKMFPIIFKYWNMQACQLYKKIREYSGNTLLNQICLPIFSILGPQNMFSIEVVAV